MVFNWGNKQKATLRKCALRYLPFFPYTCRRGGQRRERGDDASATCLMSRGHASSSIHHADCTATWNLAVPRPFFFIPHGSPWQLPITLRADKLPFKGGFFFSLSLMSLTWKLFYYYYCCCFACTSSSARFANTVSTPRSYLQCITCQYHMQEIGWFFFLFLCRRWLMRHGEKSFALTSWQRLLTLKAPLNTWQKKFNGWAPHSEPWTERAGNQSRSRLSCFFCFLTMTITITMLMIMIYLSVSVKTLCHFQNIWLNCNKLVAEVVKCFWANFTMKSWRIPI